MKLTLLSLMVALAGCSGGGDSETTPATSTTILTPVSSPTSPIPAPPTLSPTASTVSMTGVVVDGYLDGANVFLDLNGNGSWDMGEPKAVTKADGGYLLTVTPAQAASGASVVVDVPATAIDADTGLPVGTAFIMTSPADNYSVISPMTTLIKKKMDKNASLTIKDAEEEVKLKIGLSGTTIDLLADYVAAKNTGNADAANYARVHNIAKVSAEAVKNNLATVESAAKASGANADLGDIVGLIVDQVLAELGNISLEVDSQPADKFDSAKALGNTGVNIISTATVKADVAALQQEAQTPVITLSGANQITVLQGAVFNDPGVVAKSNVDGDISSSVTVSGIVNTNVVGTYVLKYDVSDQAGNKAVQVLRVVTVAAAPDTTAPVITLNGLSTVSHPSGTLYTDPSAKLDDPYATLTVTGYVNSAKKGSYILTYNAVDGAGNTATPVTRTVNVVDGTPPAVFILLGNANISIQKGATFTDPGVYAWDATDGLITTKVVVTGAVNTTVVGTYTLTYNVSDNAGNAAQPLTRTVNVANDTVLPVVTPPAAVTVEATGVSTVITNLGTATATDNIDGAITPTSSLAGPLAVGTHIITWRATDSSNNVGSATQTVTVVDTTAPSITAPAAVTVEATATLSPITLVAPTGVSDLTGTPTVVNDAPLAGFPVGNTTVTWTAIDAYNNGAVVTQVVTITDNTAPVITIAGANPASLTVGGTYTDAGATASDLVDGNLTIGVTSDVYTAVAGNYTVTYSATDTAGNSTTATRTVNVVAPAAQISGTIANNSTAIGTVTLAVYDSYTNVTTANIAITGNSYTVSGLANVGLNYVVLFIDQNGNGVWDQNTEPADYAPVQVVAGQTQTNVNLAIERYNAQGTTRCWNSGGVNTYDIEFRLSESGVTPNSVSVSGGAFATPQPLTFDVNFNRWALTAPMATLTPNTTYTFQVNDAAGVYSYPVTTSTINTCITPTALNAQPANGSTVTATPTFSWNAIAGADYYVVELFAGTGGAPNIWMAEGLAGTSVVYNGPALVAGNTYSYTVTAGFTPTDGTLEHQARTSSNTFTYQAAGVLPVVLDTTPPVVTAPASASFVSTDFIGIDTFLNSATAIDNVDGNVIVTNDAPVSLPLGTTLVIFSATDAAGNTGTATASITLASATVGGATNVQLTVFTDGWDQNTGQQLVPPGPVANAVVVADGVEYPTDASGNVFIPGLDVGVHDVHVFASGYKFISLFGYTADPLGNTVNISPVSSVTVVTGVTGVTVVTVVTGVTGVTGVDSWVSTLNFQMPIGYVIPSNSILDATITDPYGNIIPLFLSQTTDPYGVVYSTYSPINTNAIAPFTSFTATIDIAEITCDPYGFNCSKASFAPITQTLSTVDSYTAFNTFTPLTIAVAGSPNVAVFVPNNLDSQIVADVNITNSALAVGTLDVYAQNTQAGVIFSVIDAYGNVNDYTGSIQTVYTPVVYAFDPYGMYIIDPYTGQLAVQTPATVASTNVSLQFYGIPAGTTLTGTIHVVETDFGLTVQNYVNLGQVTLTTTSPPYGPLVQYNSPLATTVLNAAFPVTPAYPTPDVTNVANVGVELALNISNSVYSDPYSVVNLTNGNSYLNVSFATTDIYGNTQTYGGSAQVTTVTTYDAYGLPTGTVVDAGPAVAQLYLWNNPAVGSSVTGILTVEEVVYDYTTGIQSTVQAVDLGLQTFTVQNIGNGNSTWKGYILPIQVAAAPVPTPVNVVFPVVPPTPTTVLTLQGVMPPVGMVVDYINVSDNYGYNDSLRSWATPIVLPHTFTSWNPPVGPLSTSVSARDPYTGGTWWYQNQAPLGSIINVAATLSDVILSTNPATGGITIPANTGATIASVTLRDPYSGSSWDIMVNPQSTVNITLPAVPVSIVSPFVAGNNYDLNYTASNITGYTYISWLQSGTVGTPAIYFGSVNAESVTSPPVPYQY